MTTRYIVTAQGRTICNTVDPEQAENIAKAYAGSVSVHEVRTPSEELNRRSAAHSTKRV